MNQPKLLNLSVIHAIIFKKVKEHNRGIIVSNKLLKEWIGRCIIKKGGIPKCFIKDIIVEMCQMNLIKRLDKKKYQIMNIKIETRINKYPW